MDLSGGPAAGADPGAPVADGPDPGDSGTVPSTRAGVVPTPSASPEEVLRSLVMAHAPVVIAIVDAQERLVHIDGALLTRQTLWREALGRPVAELVDDPVIVSLVRAGLAGSAGRADLVIDGHPWLIAVRPVPAAGGADVEGDAAAVAHVAVLLTYADVATVHGDLVASEATNEQFAALIELSRDFIAIADLSGTVTYLNRAGRELIGLETDEESLGRPTVDYFTAEALMQVEEFNESLRSRGSWQGISALRHFRSGEPIPVAVDAFLVTRPSDGARLGLATVQRDLRAQLRAEHEMSLRIQEQRAVADLGRLAMTLPLGALMTEAVRLVHARYPGLVAGVLKRHGDDLEMVACSEEHWVGSAVPVDDDVLTGRAVTTGRTVRSDDLEGDDRFPGTAAGSAEHGLRSVLCSPIPGEDQPWGVVGVSGGGPAHWSEDDQTFVESVAATLGAAVRREVLEGQLQHQALHDSLTGLPNRALFLDRVAQALSRSARRGTVMAVLLLDLDDFKSVNDVLGHGSGDELLSQVARRLRAAVREVDTVARLGGDEFVVVCEELSGEEDVAFIAEALLETCATGFELVGRRLAVTASVGVALSVAGEGTTTSLVSEADIAMYQAKRDRPGTYRIFDEAMRGDVLGRINVAGELRATVRADRVDVAFQPIVDLLDGRLVAMEALARWTDDAGDPVPPDLFIPVAEETGVIGELGAAVLRRAAREAASWQAHGEVALRVNVSGHELRSHTYVDEVLATLEEAGLPPRLLGLEITESVFVDEDTLSQDNLVRLRAAGVTLLIDDFGTGYSSLAYLHRFPVVDVLKVDRVFLGEGTRGEAVIRAVTGLAEAFGLQVCAEGVETPEQHARVVALGCRLAQGFLLGRPQPPDEARRVVAGWEPVGPPAVSPPPVRPPTG